MSKSFLRNVIGEYISELGKKNNKVVVVNADLAGTCRNRGFSELFPDREFNTGIAEQNMISFAAGLACEGFIPFAFTMAPFMTMRACEQCRTDVAYGNRNVKMIGVYAGVSGGISGATHWAIEDVGIMSSIPNISVYEVSDAKLAKKLLDYSIEIEEPMYIRCGVEPVEDLYGDDFTVKKGGSIKVKDGENCAILCSGVTVSYAKEASELIENEFHKTIKVIDMYSIKPLDIDAVLDASKTGNVIVVQDHNVIGGLGSLVANVLAKNGIGIKFKILGVPDEFVAMAHAPYLYEKFGYNTKGIYDSVKEMIL